MDAQIAVIICNEKRYRLTNRGEVYRFTDSGLEKYVQAYTEEDIEDDVVEKIMQAVDVMHHAYGWDISEVNVLERVTDDQDIRNLTSRMYEPATVNFVADDIEP